MKLLTIITWATDKKSKYSFLLEKACWLSISEKILSAQVYSLAYVSNMVLWLKTGIKLVLQRQGKLKNLASKKVTLTTNNRVQAGFNSVRWKAKHWTQNQLTTRMHNYQKNTRLFENVQNGYSTSDWRNDPFFL